MRFVKTVESIFDIPQGFTRVEYLESSGTQYINTGIVPTTTTEIRMGIEVPTIPSGTRIWGGTNIANDGNATYAILRKESNNSNFNFRVSYDDIIYCSLDTNKKYDIIMNEYGSRKLIVSGNDIGTFTGTVSTNIPMYLFARNTSGTAETQYSFNTKLYYFSIKDSNGVLVRDLIPCIDPLGVPCMYDLVGKKPYYNLGTGTFTTGRQIIPVEYLEGTGTQYIDTGLDYFADFEIGIQLRANVSNKALGNGSFCCMQRYNAANPYWYFTKGSGVSNSYASSTRITEHHVMKWKDNKIYSDDVLLTEFTKDLNTPNRMCLFGVSSSNKYPNVIYFCKLWNPDDGTLVRDYIPCKDENDNGFLFDKVSGECYLNGGTGDFTFGENKYKTKLRLIKDNRLPAGYTQVEYLESSGTQLINTEIAGNNDDLSFDFKYTNLTYRTYAGIFGNYYSGESYNCWRILPSNTNDGTNYICTNTRSSSSKAVYLPLNTEFVIHIDKNNYSVNGTSYTSPTTKGTNNNKEIVIFAQRSDATDQYKAVMKLNYFQIRNNGVLIRDYIPAIDPNGVPCLYDLVSRTPFYNAGTGTFATGKPVLPMIRFIKDIIPKEYAAVNYISSANGNQYINTEYIGNSATRVIIGASSSLASSNIPLFGARDTNGYYNSFSIWQNTGANGMRFDYTDTTANVVYSHSWLTTGVNIIEKNGRYNYVNGVQVTSNNEKTFSCNNPFYLMSINTSGISINGFVGSVSFCKIYENNILVRNFIPVVRRIDKVAGMWDTITKQFFGNSGTGNFNYG